MTKVDEKTPIKLTDEQLIVILSEMVYDAAYIIRQLLEKVKRLSNERTDYEDEFLEDADEIIHLARKRTGNKYVDKCKNKPETRK